MSQMLFYGLTGLGYDTICMEARKVSGLAAVAALPDMKVLKSLLDARLNALTSST